MLLSTEAWGAPMVVRHFGSIEGLPVASASAVRVDADGFLWVATHDGLARFDGREFSIYDVANSPAMSINRINALYADAEHRLYALSSKAELLSVRSSGIARIRPDAGDRDSPIHYIDPISLCLTLNRGWYCPDGEGGFVLRSRFAESGKVALVLEAADRALWVVIPHQGVYLEEASARRLLYADAALELQQGSDGNAIVASTGAAELLLATKLGLLRVTAEGGRYLVADGGDAIFAQQLRSEGAAGTWAGAEDGLFHLVDGEVAVVAQAARPSLEIARSWRAPDGALWRSQGGDVFRESVLQLSSRGEIRDLHFDSNGAVWVSTLRDGLYALSQARVEVLNADSARINDNIYSVSLSDDGSLWLGSLGGGLQRLSSDGTIRTYGLEDGLPGLNSWVVAVAPDQSVYTATFAAGLFRKAADSDRFLPVALPSALASLQILALSFSPDGRLAIGTTEGAWSQQGDEWQRIGPEDRRARIHAILRDIHGRLLVAGTDGIWRTDGGSTPAQATALLAGVSVRGLFRDSQGTLWGSTEGQGLVRIDAGDSDSDRSRAVFIGRAAGLPSNSPHAVVEDAAGDLWVNSNQGIFRLARDDLNDFLQGRSTLLSPLTLGLADGLAELEGNGGVQPAAALDADGSIWFPSQGGVVRIDPARLPLRRQAPRTVMDGLYSQGLPVTLVNQQLPLGTRSVQLRYSAADLLAGANLRFRYRLLPAETQWTDAGSGRVAAFAALAPDRYRIEVLAGNSDGFWSKDPLIVDFVVPAYWHETRQFQWSLVLGLLLLVAGLAQWRLTRLRQRAVALDAQVHLRTQELSSEKVRVEATLAELAQAHDDLALTHGQIEIRNLRLADQTARLEALDRFRTRLFADVSHELRTPLMLIKLPLRELYDGARKLPSAYRESLQLPLQQTERLSHLVEQLVGLVQAEAGQLCLKVRRLDLMAWIGRVTAGFEPMAAKQQVQLTVRSALSGLQVYADADHLTTILSNLLDNALKYAPPGSAVLLTTDIDANDSCVRIGVVDRGPGYPPELADSLFDRFVRAEGPPRAGREGLGIGLALARELIEVHGGRIGTSTSAAEGTAFWFELPLGSAHIALDEVALEPAVVAETPVLALASGGGILLVEDHPELAAYLGERLAESFPVRVVADAEAALVEMQKGDIQLLVSDVKLPGMDGVTLCRSLKKMPVFATLPVILISAKSTGLDRDAGLAAGASAWLTKPFELASLIAEIRRYWPACPAPGTAPAIAYGAAAELHDPLLRIALEHLAEPTFGVAGWSQAAYLSDRQLRRRVGELTGLSPIVWLREQRLHRVRELISSGTCQTLAEAGYRCGFDNPNYLYRLYRAQFSET